MLLSWHQSQKNLGGSWRYIGIKQNILQVFQLLYHGFMDFYNFIFLLRHHLHLVRFPSLSIILAKHMVVLLPPVRMQSIAISPLKCSCSALYSSSAAHAHFWQSVVCLSLCVCTHTFVHSGISDSATPWTVVRQAPLSMEFSRQAYWSRLLFPTPRDETCVSCTSCTGRRMLRPCTAWKLPVVLPFPECHINTESF